VQNENESADEFLEEWFRKKTRFETEGKGNLEMAYCVRHLPHCGQMHDRDAADSAD